MTDQAAKARHHAEVRVVLGVLIGMLTAYGGTHIQMPDGAAMLAGRALGIFLATLSVYLVASGIKSHPNLN